MDIPVSITLTNNRDEEVTTRLPAGLIIEAPTEYGVQNVALEREYVFKLPARSTKDVTVRGRCLNRKRSAPTSTKGRITLYRYAGSSMNQSDIWKTTSTPKK